jgi:hypothetical protein
MPLLRLTKAIGSVTNNDNGTWSWSFATSDGPAQSQTVTIGANDGNGGTAETSFSLTVNNAAPAVNAITVPLNPIDITNQPVFVSATFSDPAGTYDEPYICTIDFGDGSGPQAGTVSGMTCSGSHTYANAGVYVVTVTVTDKDNETGSATAEQAIVIYDFTQVVLFATNSIWLKQGADVLTGNVLVNDVSPGPVLDSQVELSVGENVTTAAGFAIKANSIKAKQGATVNSEVFITRSPTTARSTAHNISHSRCH